MTLTIIEFGMIQIKDLLTFRINFLRPNWYQGNWIIGLEMASILMTRGRKRPPVPIGLKFCKNKFLKCCFLAEFKKWHQFLCEDDLWSKIVTNKFVRLVKYCKNQFSKVAFLRNLISLSVIKTVNHHRETDVIFLNSAKKQHFENWFLH